MDCTHHACSPLAFLQGIHWTGLPQSFLLVYVSAVPLLDPRGVVVNGIYYMIDNAADVCQVLWSSYVMSNTPH